MSQKVMEFYEFGGVDSRSNPLNMPSNRSLRCKNWVPLRSGNLMLRWGYSRIAQYATRRGYAWSGMGVSRTTFEVLGSMK